MNGNVSENNAPAPCAQAAGAVPGVSRRDFLVRSAQGAFAAAFVFSAANSQSLAVTRLTVRVKGLPAELSGYRIAFASDFHHGVSVPIDTVRAAVRTINALKPDVVLLGGDYVSILPQFYGPVMSELARLAAPDGVCAVPGNHEYWAGMPKYRSALAAIRSIRDLTNAGFEVTRGRANLWIAGLDDNWGGAPDANAAVSGAPEGVARIVFMHNPTLADELPQRYADLILAGHTHGWQIYIPGVTRFLIPHESMRRYRAGFYHTRAGLMYVTRGVGLIGLPVRLWCSPEVVLVTLMPAAA
jgi:hypothetical protein